MCRKCKNYYLTSVLGVRTLKFDQNYEYIHVFFFFEKNLDAGEDVLDFGGWCTGTSGVDIFLGFLSRVVQFPHIKSWHRKGKNLSFFLFFYLFIMINSDL